MTQHQALHGFELSAQQARVASYHRTDPDFETRAELRVTLPDGVELGRLRASLERVIARHEILRTRYELLPGMAVPVQVIDEPDAARAVELAIEAGGGARIAIVRVAAASADAASLQLLAAEWLRAYADAAPAEPPLQYADYAAWRNELVGTGEARAFWEHQLAQRAPVAGLPLLRSAGGPNAPCHLAAHAIELPRELWEACVHCAASLGIESVQIALAAWVVLWHRHADADRVTLAFDAQQRGEHLGDALGLFSEPLPLTAELAADAPVAELCRALAARAAELVDWRDYAPRFDGALPIGFRMLPALDPVLAEHGWSIEADSPTLPAQLVLDVRDSDAARGPQLLLRYNRHRYSASAAALLGDQLVAALADICRDPQRAVRAVQLVGAAERGALEQASRPDPVDADRAAAYERITAAPHLAACFDSRAARAAVVAESGALTYEELDARAARLAAVLASRGVGRGRRVAHVLPRDLDAIVALLAILRTGAVYVPIDPSYPERRIAFVLDDCGADALVTRRALIDRLPPAWRQASERRLVLTDEAVVANPAPPAAIDPGDPAYLIYTSGSTGEPKGVPIAHRAALHSLGARFAYYPTQVRRFLLLSSFAFDSSIAGLVWTLAQGGCLHLAGEAELRDPARLAARILDENISHVLALPSLYHLILEQLAGRAGALDTVIVAGEACSRPLVEAHERALPSVRLYNEYGPTEAAVWSTVARCRADAGRVPSVPIGRPILGSRVHVLDAAGAPVARGVRGEIHIGGAGLAAGYLDRPALTAERFVEIGGERLYRTGDLGAWDDGGDLHFLGRGDGQIKIRGFRVELGEIEAALAVATGAATVAVVARRGEDGALLLRGFVESAERFDAAVVRGALAAELPAHMIPVDLAALPALPRTANGKLDRAALATLEVQTGAPYVAPRSDTERALAALWTELLGAERAAAVGRDDNFFARGGHSLLVVRLVHRVREELGVELPISAVFDQPRLAALAAVIDERRSAAAASPAGVELLRAAGETSPVLFCIHHAAGAVRHYAPLAAALPIDARVVGLHLPPKLDDRDGIAAIAAAHAGAMRTAQPAGPYRLCGWSIGGVIAHEIARQLEAAGERVAFLALLDSTPHTEDQPLPWATLLARLCGELTTGAVARLDALPGAALDALRTAVEDQPPVAQLRHALLAWAPQHALALAAPVAAVEAALAAAATARRWLAGHQPGRVAANLHLWWSDDTLRRDPALPAYWRQRTHGVAHGESLDAGHDDLLAQPALATALAAALAAVRGDA